MIYIVLSAIAIIIAMFYFKRLAGVEGTVETLCIAYFKSVNNGENAKEALNDMVNVAIKMAPMLKGMSSENYLNEIYEDEYVNMPTNIEEASSFVKSVIKTIIISYTHKNIYPNYGVESMDDMFKEAEGKQKTNSTLLNEMIEDKYSQYCS